MNDANAKSSSKGLEICVMSTYVDEKGELEAKVETAKKFHADFTNNMEIQVGSYKIQKDEKGKVIKCLDNGLVYSKNSNGKYIKKAKVEKRDIRE